MKPGGIRRFVPALSAVCVIMLGVGLNVLAQRSIDLASLSRPAVSNVVHIPRSETTTRVLSFGFSHLLADLYLIKTQVFLFDNQYNFEALDTINGLFNLITVLDPHYFEAYQLAFHSMSEFFDLMGVANANELIRRGWRYEPYDCRFPKMLGFNYYQSSTDPVTAATYLLVAHTLGKDENRDCPSSMLWMADAVNMRKGTHPCTRQKLVCEQLSDLESQRQDKNFLKLLAKRCSGLTVMCQLDSFVELFRERFGACPKDIEDLRKGLGAAGELPEEPFGGYYFIDESCQVQSSTQLSPNH